MRIEIQTGTRCYIKYTDGTEEWLEDDVLHRLDGPAYINPAGFQFWHVHGKQVHSFKQLQTVSGISDEAVTLLVLRYGEIKCYLY